MRFPETQRRRDACGSGLHGIRADPSPAQELPRAFERPKPFLERRQDSDDDVLLCPERRRRIWRLLPKPKSARNFKDLKHLKRRYTFRIRAVHGKRKGRPLDEGGQRDLLRRLLVRQEVSAPLANAELSEMLTYRPSPPQTRALLRPPPEPQPIQSQAALYRLPGASNGESATNESAHPA